MNPIDLALLRSLVLRPHECSTPALRSQLESMRAAGLIERCSAGWVATVQGCLMVEQQRSAAVAEGFSSG